MIKTRRMELLEYYSMYYAGKASKKDQTDVTSSSASATPSPQKIKFMAWYAEEADDGTHAK
jgi:hypothetical protein